MSSSSRSHLLRDYGPNDGGDFLSVVQVNAAPSKLDAFLQREVEYKITFDPPTGSVEGTVTVQLHEVSGFRVNGCAMDAAVFTEYELARAMVQVQIELGGEAAVEYRIRGTLKPCDSPLLIAKQPLAFADRVSVDIEPTDGWLLAAASPTLTDFRLLDVVEVLLGCLASNSADSQS